MQDRKSHDEVKEGNISSGSFYRETSEGRKREMEGGGFFNFPGKINCKKSREEESKEIFHEMILQKVSIDQ